MLTEEDIRLFWFALRDFKEQRRGQAMMNALYVVRPDVYRDISGTKYDIFYTDTSQDIYRFREYLGI